ncbi:MAG: adenylate/guanylate cyclase domain-containing protein [Bacteroidales bacterium]|nr:adenylate/guanylate cyclase domain-containing protein [Bacteroidales bacterium]
MTKAIPKFFGLRIYLTAITIFVLLVFPISMIMLFKYGPYWLEEREALNKTQFQFDRSAADPLTESKKDTIAFDSAESNAQRKNIAIEPEDLRFQKTLSLLFRMMLASMLLGFVWNYPFKRYFSNRRKNKAVSEQLLNFCRKWLLKVPVINSFILGFGFFVTIIYMGFEVFGNDFTSSSSRQFYEQFFFISIFASFLTVLFVYFWFRHRVRFVYLEHVYDSVSLYTSTENKYRDHIIRRLWINSIMTTLLPLVIVVFYLSLSKTAIREANADKLSSEQIEVLFGKYVPFIEQANLFQSEHLFYVNAIDSLLMFVGIFSGITISIVYLFFFVNWTHNSIVIPLKEVVEKMRQQGEDELGRLAILRTNDEIGELANGYNEMAMRITGNITALKEITEANQRFVPEEFLQILGKKSITDVALGDQIQKHMTILFIDIRSFTTISEKLSPKENFDFLNDYLGYMEPVIRAHNGFIDKFIGDSIMALFGDKAEDAIDAALEMHERLKEFNLMLKQVGRPPIDTGAGIHSGNLMLGVVGGEGRMETTVISDSVNLASRLEGLTRNYDAFLIVSESTLELVENKNSYTYKYLDEVKVKGRTGAVKVYAVTDKIKV